VAVDPEWPARPYLYFNYTHATDVSYITMYTASGDLSSPGSTNLTLSSPFHILTDAPDQFEVHNGGTLRFGTDGMLFTSFGDDGNPCSAQDPDVLTGKILRLDVSSLPGAGSGPPPKSQITPPGNPFSSGSENARLIWAWGLRNPFRFTIDPVTGDLYIGDVGDDFFEELDWQTYPTSTDTNNFGWPLFEGFLDRGGTCGTTVPYTDPVWVYGHEAPSQTIIAGPLYRADGNDPYLFPIEYRESFFFMDHYDGHIRRLVQSGDDWVLAPPVPGQLSSLYWGEEFFNTTDFQMGSDGALYYMKGFGTGRGLYRIRPTTPTGVETAAHSAAPLEIFPNPVQAGDAVSIRIASGDGPIALRIIDVSGRTVRTLLGANPSNGQMSTIWDGRMGGGHAAPAGVYFVRLERGGTSLSSKVTILR
jgi:hypothetical protein